MTKLFAGAALIALLAPGAAFAGKREPVSAEVSTAGLDLGSAAGVRRLQGRIARAVYAACNPADRVETGRSPDWQCRRELLDDADAKVLAIRQSHPSTYASVMTLGRGTD